MSHRPDPPTAGEGADRRSLRTQQALMDALLELLSARHYDMITIKDIVEQANVGRSTFYAHYQSKDDLLMSGLGLMLDGLLQQIVLSGADQTLKLDTTGLFRHARGHFELYRTLVWGSGFELLIKDGHAALNARLEQRLGELMAEKQSASIPLPLLSYTLAGTLLILLKWWLDNKMPYPAERMDEIFQQLVMPGVRLTLQAGRDPAGRAETGS